MLRKTYYCLKPFIPREVQLSLRRRLAAQKMLNCTNCWPIDTKAGLPPKNWTGWPDNKQFAIILTHDVESARGQGKCRELLEMEKSLGFRSSFNFVPERYEVSTELRHNLTANGFEVGLHGLKHDGKLYQSRSVFTKRARRINRYLKSWQAVGFRSPAMHHNLEWLHDLDIEYDASTFDTDPFEPQADGVGTIFPFIVQDERRQKAYVELPYTLPQDFTLFVILKEKGIDIWKKKLDWIAEQGGMALLNVHPDYLHFNGAGPGPEEFPAAYYRHFLEYLRETYRGQYWHGLPKDVARWLRAGEAANEQLPQEIVMPGGIRGEGTKDFGAWARAFYFSLRNAWLNKIGCPQRPQGRS